MFLVLFSLFLILIGSVFVVKADFTQNKIDSKITKSLENSDEVRVVIKLKDVQNKFNFVPASNEYTLTAANNVVDEIGEENVKYVFDEGKTIDAFVNAEDVENLKNNNNVESVQLEGIKYLMLQESVPLINGTITQRIQQNGINLTGIGQTICIIDSGVNYSHADFGGCYGNNVQTSNCKVIGGYDYCADNSVCSTEDSIPEDAYGHGTHVSGIAAANGSITGVAPGAKIVMIKACNATGACSDGDIAAGINWCVSNRSIFNISVISMSLGGADYTSYCESDNAQITSAINSAVAQNISVVVAAGNSYLATKISAPSCVQNATPVSATTKLDVIDTSYANRNALVMLMAPGTSINSTYLSGGYTPLSGTSMATPHFAGAIVILRQYMNLTGQSKTPQQIEDLLNSTGKFIPDTAPTAVANYSRIDIYSAVNELSFNYVNLTSPSINLVTKQNQTFICNVSSNNGLSNITYYLWNSTGLENYSTQNVSGLINGSVFSYNFTHEDNYSWNCLGKNNLSFSKMASSNYSLRYDITTPVLTINLPVNNSWNNGRFNVSLNENGSCFYSLNGTANRTMSSTDNRNFYATNGSLVQDSVYNISYSCNDSAGNMNISNMISFTNDLTTPNITLNSPAEGYSATGAQTLVFYYNVTDNLNLSSCSLIMDGSSVGSNATAVVNNSENNISYETAVGTHNWQINCTDLAGNVGSNGTRSLTINAVVVQNNNNGGGSSGGGGAPASANYVLTEEQASSGYTKSLALNDKITLDINNNQHSVKVNNLASDRVNLTIQSNPIYVVLGIGQDIRINLTSADYYDLYVKLEGVSGTKANVTVREINESISESNKIGEIDKTSSNESNISKDNKGWKWVIIGVGVLVILIVVILFAEGHRRHRKKRR